MPLVKFMGRICISLIIGRVQSSENGEGVPTASVCRSLRVMDFQDVIRYDKTNHWPALVDTRDSQRCKKKDYKKKTKFYCTKY